MVVPRFSFKISKCFDWDTKTVPLSPGVRIAAFENSHMQPEGRVMRAVEHVFALQRRSFYEPKSSRTAKAEATNPVRSASRAAGMAWRVRWMPAEPKYTAMV